MRSALSTRSLRWCVWYTTYIIQLMCDTGQFLYNLLCYLTKYSKVQRYYEHSRDQKLCSESINLTADDLIRTLCPNQ